jgi:hypothetical protein
MDSTHKRNSRRPAQGKGKRHPSADVIMYSSAHLKVVEGKVGKGVLESWEKGRELIQWAVMLREDIQRMFCSLV